MNVLLIIIIILMLMFCVAEHILSDSFDRRD